jgi:hypothetical protein
MEKTNLNEEDKLNETNAAMPFTSPDFLNSRSTTLPKA